MSNPVSNDRAPVDPKTGYFEFAQLSPGTYTLWTSALEYENEKKTIEVAARESKVEVFYVHKRRDVEPPWG